MSYCKNGDVRFNAIVKGKSKSAQIFLVFNFQKKRLRYFTGKRIELSNWDEKKQRVKVQSSQASSINNYLKQLAAFIDETYTNAQILKEIPTVEYLREKLKDAGNKIPTSPFFSCFDTFIKENKTYKAPTTITSYQNTLNHIKKFSSSKNYSVEFNSIDRKFYIQFTEYLINDLKLTNNTVAKVIKTIKVFMSYASKENMHSKMDYLGFKSSEIDGEIIFLTWDELMKLYNLEIESKKFANVRDVFCFQCFTGLRYSDIKNLRKDSVVEDFLHINVIKKREKKTVSIPLIPYAKEIIAKYAEIESEKLLPTISNQKMNEYLKDIGKLAELTEPVIIVHYRGAERIEKVHPKHEVLSTHVGRKTFITNALDREVSAEVVMSISGHSTHKAFKRYYKVLEDRKKREIFKAFEK